jgi:dUTP pyrophosphatase
MIVPGRLLIPKVVNSVLSAHLQAQPCGVDLSLRRIFSFKSAGCLDFDNTHRQTATAVELPIMGCTTGAGESWPSTSTSGKEERQAPDATQNSTDKLQRKPNSILLLPGSYSVEFNETVDVPLDMMGQIFPRSSLFRSGASLTTGVVDSGYHGPLGGLLVVSNIYGLRLYEGAKLAQVVFHQMSENVEGYNGTYQGREFHQ